MLVGDYSVLSESVGPVSLLFTLVLTGLDALIVGVYVTYSEATGKSITKPANMKLTVAKNLSAKAIQDAIRELAFFYAQFNAYMSFKYLFFAVISNLVIVSPNSFLLQFLKLYDFGLLIPLEEHLRITTQSKNVKRSLLIECFYCTFFWVQLKKLWMVEILSCIG